MKKQLLYLLLTLCFTLTSFQGSAQTQFWSDTFEDSAAPSAGIRTPSTDTGFPSVPYAYYFLRTDGTNLNLQPPFPGDAFTTYQNAQGNKFWAGEDTDRASTGVSDITDKVQNITWTGINIAGKTALSFKGLFAAHRNQGWQNPTFGVNYDFLIVEYSIDGGTWTRVGGFNGDVSSINAGYLREDTNGDDYGDGTELSKTFQEFEWSIGATGSSLSLRFRVSADASVAQEFAIDNFRLFETEVSELLSTSPTLTFSSNTDISTDDRATDGEGGAVNISDINIEIYNISDINGTFASPLSWQGTDFYFAGAYTGLTNQLNAGSKGMAIKSDDGSEFQLNQFDYLNWGESASFTNTVKGFRDGNEVASTTFDGYSASFTPMTIALNAAFNNVDEVRFYITSGGYVGNQSATNHSINNIQVSSPVACTPPTISTNPPNRTICAGNNTTFAASASDATAYQWQVNTGSGYTDITNGAPYSGANTTTLTVTGATVGMSGYQYRMVAINGIATCFTNTNSSTLTISNVMATQSQTNVSCFGGSNGSATVTPSGGIAPYSYSWSPSGGIGATATGLSVGSYTVTITDNIGCQTTRNFTITQPTALALTRATQTNIACNGGATGAASVNIPTGGSAPYTYDWSGTPTGDGTTSVSGLTAGTWTCTVTDANGCSQATNFTITQPTELKLTAASLTNIACFGGSTGAASVYSATGGAGGYTYNWTPGNPVGDGTTSVSGLTAGSWTCTVTDANGCTQATNFTITQPSAISTATGSQTNVSCNGGSNGSASVTPSGGTPNYTYSWSPSGGTAATATGLTAGGYTVTVTDAYGCQATRNFTITQPAAISTATGSQTNVSCNGGSNGSASVTPSGGTPGYTYSWSPSGGTAATATSLAAGSYTVTVTDTNGCTATRNFTITQPSAIDSNVSLNTGILSATQAGASYQWYACPDTVLTDETSQNFTPTEVGEYKVEITVNGCVVESSCITVSTLGVNDVKTPSKFSIYPNPSSSVLHITSPQSDDFQIVDMLGKIVHRFKVGAQIETTVNVDVLSEGMYFVRSMNSNYTYKLVVKRP